MTAHDRESTDSAPMADEQLLTKIADALLIVGRDGVIAKVMAKQGESLMVDQPIIEFG